MAKVKPVNVSSILVTVCCHVLCIVHYMKVSDDIDIMRVR